MPTLLLFTSTGGIGVVADSSAAVAAGEISTGKELLETEAAPELSIRGSTGSSVEDVTAKLALVDWELAVEVAAKVDPADTGRKEKKFKAMLAIPLEGSSSGGGSSSACGSLF